MSSQKTPIVTKGSLTKVIKDTREDLNKSAPNISSAIKKILNRKNAIGSDMLLDTADGQIKLNRIYGKTVKSRNLFKWGINTKDLTTQHRSASQQLNVTVNPNGSIRFTFPHGDNLSWNICRIQILGQTLEPGEGNKDFSITYKIKSISQNMRNVNISPSLYISDNNTGSRGNLFLDIWGGNREGVQNLAGSYFEIYDLQVIRKSDQMETFNKPMKYTPPGLWSVGNGGYVGNKLLHWYTYRDGSTKLTSRLDSMSTEQIPCKNGDSISIKYYGSLVHYNNNIDKVFKITLFKNGKYSTAVTYTFENAKNNSVTFDIREDYTSFCVSVNVVFFMGHSQFLSDKLEIRVNNKICIPIVSHKPFIKDFDFVYKRTDAKHGAILQVNKLGNIPAGKYRLIVKYNASESSEVHFTDAFRAYDIEHHHVFKGYDRILTTLDIPNDIVMNRENILEKSESSAAVITAVEAWLEPIYSVTYMPIDEPLRSVGEYRDYIDIENRRIVRWIKSIILDGSVTYTVGGPNNRWEAHNIEDEGNEILLPDTDYTMPIALCGTFHADTSHNVFNAVRDCSFCIATSVKTRLIGGYHSQITSAETAKTFFKKNPTEFLVVRKEPKMEYLTEEQLLALTSIKSFDGKTHIYSPLNEAEFDLDYGDNYYTANGLSLENKKIRGLY